MNSFKTFLTVHNPLKHLNFEKILFQNIQNKKVNYAKKKSTNSKVFLFINNQIKIVLKRRILKNMT